MSHRFTIQNAVWLTSSARVAAHRRPLELPCLRRCFSPTQHRSLHFPQYPPRYENQASVIPETNEKLLAPSNVVEIDEGASGSEQHLDDLSSKSLVSERDEQLYSESNNATVAVQWFKARECLRSLDNASFAGLRSKLEAYRRLGRSLLGPGEVEGVRTRWLEIGYRKSLYALVGCLSLHARDALTALEAMTIVPDKFIVTSDALLYLRHSRWHEIEQDLQLKQRFFIQTAKLRHEQRWPDGYMSSKCLDLILDNADKDEARKVLRDYLDAYSDLREEELIYVIHRFHRLGDADSALSLLRTLPRASLQQEQGAVLAACINLMDLESVDRAAQPYSLKILPALLELGVRPNVGVYNKAVQNAFRLGLPKVGWDLYRYMKTQGRFGDGYNDLGAPEGQFSSLKLASAERDDVFAPRRRALASREPVLSWLSAEHSSIHLLLGTQIWVIRVTGPSSLCVRSGLQSNATGQAWAHSTRPSLARQRAQP